MNLNRFISLLAYLILVLGCLAVVWIPSQNQSELAIGLYSIAFASYGILLYSASKGRLKVGVALSIGVFIRFVLVFIFPNLSNDVYRFIWDGQLAQLGINPLSYTPTEFLSIADQLVHKEFSELYLMLNSPDYYTIYPPLSQLVYYIGTLFECSWQASAQLMKAILFTAELGTGLLLIRILTSIGKSPIWAIAYFLNPLVIVEVVGQLHFEGLMVFFLAAVMALLLRERHSWAGCALALSIGAKLLPLMFLPVILNYLGDRNRRVNFLLGFSATMFLIFTPFFWTLDLGHFLESVNLYFQKFEFNASVYYLLRGVGQYLTGYNQIAIIGPLLSLSTLLGVLFLSFRKRVDGFLELIQLMFYCFALYLCFATTVHPWYLCMLLFLSVTTRQLWPIIWSGVVIWSYTTYAPPYFEQNLYVITLEYVIVAIAIGIEYYSGKGIKKA